MAERFLQKFISLMNKKYRGELKPRENQQGFNEMVSGANAMRFTGRGMDGQVQPEKPAGVVHEGEVVVPDPVVRMNGGPEAVERKLKNTESSEAFSQGQQDPNKMGELPGFRMGGLVKLPKYAGGLFDIAKNVTKNFVGSSTDTQTNLKDDFTENLRSNYTPSDSDSADSGWSRIAEKTGDVVLPLGDEAPKEDPIVTADPVTPPEIEVPDPVVDPTKDYREDPYSGGRSSGELFTSGEEKDTPVAEDFTGIPDVNKDGVVNSADKEMMASGWYDSDGNFKTDIGPQFDPRSVEEGGDVNFRELPEIELPTLNMNSPELTKFRELNDNRINMLNAVVQGTDRWGSVVNASARSMLGAQLASKGMSDAQAAAQAGLKGGALAVARARSWNERIQKLSGLEGELAINAAKRADDALLELGNAIENGLDVEKDLVKFANSWNMDLATLKLNIATLKNNMEQFDVNTAIKLFTENLNFGLETFTNAAAAGEYEVANQIGKTLLNMPGDMFDKSITDRDAGILADNMAFWMSASQDIRPGTTWDEFEGTPAYDSLVAVWNSQVKNKGNQKVPGKANAEFDSWAETEFDNKMYSNDHLRQQFANYGPEAMDALVADMPAFNADGDYIFYNINAEEGQDKYINPETGNAWTSKDAETNASLRQETLSLEEGAEHTFVFGGERGYAAVEKALYHIAVNQGFAENEETGQWTAIPDNDAWSIFDPEQPGERKDDLTPEGSPLENYITEESSPYMKTVASNLIKAGEIPADGSQQMTFSDIRDSVLENLHENPEIVNMLADQGYITNTKTVINSLTSIPGGWDTGDMTQGEDAVNWARNLNVPTYPKSSDIKDPAGRTMQVNFVNPETDRGFVMLVGADRYEFIGHENHVFDQNKEKWKTRDEWRRGSLYAYKLDENGERTGTLIKVREGTQDL